MAGPDHNHHGHNHHGHHHHGDGANERRVFWAMLLTGSFMVVEVAGGLISGSLALVADAAHMLTDTASLAMAWLAFRFSRKPADTMRSYGYQRLQVLAAFVNGISLLAIVAWIAVEAVQRLISPVEVMSATMLAVAVAGLVVNVGAFALLHGGDRGNLNIRGALLHVMGDLLGSAAAIVAALVIMFTGWMPVDPLLSLLVAALILRSGWALVRQSSHILLEGTPTDVDVAAMKAALCEAIPEVSDIHHVHVWSLTEERPLVTLHATVAADADYNQVLAAIKQVLEDRFAIRHSTVQMEPGVCFDPAPGERAKPEAHAV